MLSVSVVLSLYKPNPEWLRQQLESLNAQTYDNLELLVWNDCPDENIDRNLFMRTVTRFPVSFYDEKRNLGYISAFGKLSRIATGDLISYCDQDDIWDPEKIKICVDAIQKDHAVAAVCDRALMDGNGKVFCPSVKAVSKRKADTWKSGEDITERAAFISYCTGMTLVARRDLVQKFLPFVPILPHDQQLAFLLSGAGKISYVDLPLVRHRRFGMNASGTLAGVEKKQDYYDTRCKPVIELIDRYEKLYHDDPRIECMRKCCNARIKGDIFQIVKYRRMIPDLFMYEIGLAVCPDFIFRILKRYI